MALEAARRTVASFLGAQPGEVVFTSGGTESDNLAIFGAVRRHGAARKHVITSAIEHPAVLGPCRQLEQEGVAVTYVPVDGNAQVDPESVRRALRPETILISVMHANNETGTVQPIAEIGAIARDAGVLLHSDGVQAAGRIPLSLSPLGIHLYSVSGHKLYAPKGIGALWIAKGTTIMPLHWGGRHERERRAGTENVAGAVALARAVQLAAAHDGSLRDHFEDALCKQLNNVVVHGRSVPRLPNTSSVQFTGLEGESLVIALDRAGMAVSSGSACSSGSIEPSHVLLAMGLNRAEARATVRFSFGRSNSVSDVEQLVEAVVAAARRMTKSRLREVSYA